VADGVGYLVNKVKELGVAFLGAIVDGDQMRRGLNAIYKDSAVTAAQIDFLRRSSSESGVAFGQLSKEFVKFSASMQLSNVPLEQSNNLFKAVTAATASLGLGSEATAGALNALGQMASKGTVSLEELRQQLGDRLPGAIGLTAQGLGITEAQLIKLVESGGLATRDFIVPFTEALGKLKGENDGLVPAFDRLKGTLTEIAQGMGDAGGTQTLLLALKALGGVFGSLVLGLSTIVEYIFLCAKTWGILAAAVVTATNPMEALSKALSDATGRLAKQGEALTNFIAPSEAAAASTTKHAAALTANTVEVVKSINANASLSAEQKLTALATALNADATLNASAKMVQFNVAAAELISKQEGLTDSYAKNAKAAKEQGDTLVSLAKLTGDATAIQTASIQAAEMYSFALDKVAASQAAELTMLTAQKDQLEKYRIAQGLTTEQIKVQADALDKKIITGTAEAEQARQAALAQKAELFERKLAVELLKDHSAQVDNFKKAMQDATKTLQEYERLAINGKKTEAEVTEARKAVTTATVLYKDAVADLISKTELKTKADSTSLQLSAAQAKAGAEHSLVLAAQARALGDTATAIYYEIKAREQNIAAMKLEIQIRDLEAKAALATIELKQKQLDLTTEEGKKQSEIMEIEKKVIAIKLLANGATKDAIEAMEREITALRDGVDLRGKSAGNIDRETGARNTNTTAIDRQTSALEAQNAAQKRANAALEESLELERKRLGVDKNGFSTDKNGGTLVAGGDLTTRTGIKDFLKKAGVNDDAEATRITNEFANSKGEIDYFSNAGQMKYGGANSTISQALLKAAEKYTFAGKPIGGAADDDITTQKTKYDLLKGTKELTTTTGSNKTVVKTDESGQVVKATTTLNNVTDGIRSPSAAPAPAPTPANSGQTVLVKIDLGNGRSYDVNTASANDASQLTDFMNALQNAKRGAGM
jgi:tape measure domain-containing protein